MMADKTRVAPEGNQKGRRRALAWAAVFFLVVFVLPAAGLWLLTERFEASAETAREAECRKKARELVMRLRSALDRNVVITEKLGLFRHSVVSERRGRQLDAASAGRHDEALRRILTSGSGYPWERCLRPPDRDSGASPAARPARLAGVSESRPGR